MVFSRRFSISTAVALLFLASLLVGACSDDTPADGDTSLDASQDVSPDSTDVSHADAGGTDASEADGGLTAEEESNLLAYLGSRIGSLKFVDDTYGVNFTRQRSNEVEYRPRDTIAFLIDYSNPADVQLRDTLVAEDGQLQGAVFGGKVATVRAQIRDGILEMTATSYDVSEGSFEMVDQIDVTPEGATACTLYDVVSNQSTIVAACNEQLVELNMDAQGLLEMVGSVDRTDVYERDRWRNLMHRQALSDDGYLIERYSDVRVWRIPSLQAASESPEDSALVTRIDTVSSRGWAYVRQTGMHYIAGDTTEDTYVVDLSDPTAPAVANHWNIEEEWGREAQIVQAAAASPERFYAYYFDIDGLGKAIWAFEVGNDPTVLRGGKVRYLRELPKQPQAIGDMVVHNGYLYYQYSDDSLEAPHMSIAGVSVDEFDQPVDLP